MRYVRLSNVNAALHSVYPQDAKAVFFDLNDDGVNEILATHFSSAKHANGEWLLYVLQKDENGKYVEITGEPVYFNATHPICISSRKVDGFRNLQVVNNDTGSSVTFVFDSGKGLYFKK